MPPIRTVDEEGTVRWRLPNGPLHRVDGPAVEWPDGSREWYQNGLHHREGGPAYEFVDGTRYWVQNDLTHREDGPAIEWAGGKKEWWLNGLRKEIEELKIFHPVLYNQMLVYEVLKE